MLIVCFGDGLGNQMFQYAFYLQLQRLYPTQNIKMDIFNFYGDDIHNGFELDRIFGIIKNECTQEELEELIDYCPIVGNKYKIRNKLYRIKQILLRKRNSTVIYQTDATIFNSQVLELNFKSKILRGNWINEKYFDLVKNELSDIFCFPTVKDHYNKSVLDDVQQTKSVSVHIRRGDYVESSMISLLDRYYNEAIEYISEKQGKCKFFFFSDDADYVKEHFGHLDNICIVDGNRGSDSWKDMFLMSKCKHNIIANSTFSFWGAYLNKNREKIVIAPSKAAPQFENAFACYDWVKITI